ncbi:hypothetical protein ABKV19_007927 [Rosa sericea]
MGSLEEKKVLRSNTWSAISDADKSPDSKDPWCFNFYAYKATFRQSIYSAFGLLLLNNQPSSDRFSRGKLIDAYRFLHKEKDMERGFSWSGNPIGKYRGKRMRIDYFIAAEQLKDRIVSCEMHGQGMNYKVLLIVL